MKKRVLLVAAKTGYQIREFYGAAERLGVELVLASDRCHVLEDPWGDQASPVHFATPAEGIRALAARGPFDGVLAVGDGPARVAAEAANRMGLRYHPPGAARAAADKFSTRELFRAAGMNVPPYMLIAPHQATEAPEYPCVIKPLHLSASRGVIRANDPAEFAAALARIRKMVPNETLLSEGYVPGKEFSLEGVVTAGRLQTLAIFDKPDPLEGPYFEETIYVTPSREPASVQAAISRAAQEAVSALGLTYGPVHAEMRVNSSGVWMLEAAARPIGGLCSRVLRFRLSRNSCGLEELLLRHAVGEAVGDARLKSGAHGVMMVPIPAAGVFAGVDGVQEAAQTADIEAVEVTAKEGQLLEPLPEGASYLGFLFARGATPQGVEQALRKAHNCLRFRVSEALPVVR